MTPAALPERIAAKIQATPDGCWHWTAARNRDGYGIASISGTSVLAHRLIYGLLVGPIGDGLTIDHACHPDDDSCPGGAACTHRGCVNPAHLRQMTMAANAAANATARRNGSRTHCPQGHPYAGDNLYVIPSNGSRMCRTCVRASHARSRARRRELADAGHAAPRLLARAALLLVLTVLASVMSWNAPAGTPLALLIAASAWYVLARLLGAGALATGRHQRSGGGR